MIALKLKDNISMDNPNQPHAKASQQHLVLDELKDVFCDCFEALVDDCCYRLEIDFGIQLGSKRTQLEKQTYSDLLQSIKQQKKSIQKAYLQEVSALFESTNSISQTPEEINLLEAQLAQDASVEEDFILKKIVRNSKHLFMEDLNKLNHKIAAWAGRKVIAEKENPVCPANLVQALVAVIGKLNLKTEYKVALYKVFNDKVFSQLGFVYGELNKISKAASAPLLKVADNKEIIVNTPNESFKKLQKNLINWRNNQADSAYKDMSLSYDELDETYELYEINNALEIIRQFAEYDSDDLQQTFKPIKWLVKQKLDDIAPDCSTKRLSKNNEDTLDLIAYLFQHIKNESSISEQLRISLLKLIYPFSELALSNYAFLFEPKGVGRQLIDALYEAVIFVDLNNHSATPTQEKIDKLVSCIFTDSSCGIDEIKGLLDDFVIFMQKNSKRHDILQQRTIQLIKNKENLELSKQFVNREITLCVQGKALPEKIGTFLFDVWQDYLLLIYLRKDDEPEVWVHALDAMKNLISSVTPPKDDLERKQILKLLPSLIKELRAGLKRISYDKHSQSAFFKELAVFHVLLMNKNELQMDTVNTQQAPAPIEDLVEQYDLTEDDSYSQVAEVKLGQWLAFNINSEITWGQLAWKSEETNLYLFTDKYGNKLIKITLKDLLGHFKNNRVVIEKFYAPPFTEHVFNQL